MVTVRRGVNRSIYAFEVWIENPMKYGIPLHQKLLWEELKQLELQKNFFDIYNKIGITERSDSISRDMTIQIRTITRSIKHKINTI